MLKRAILFKEEVIGKMVETFDNPRYQYYHYNWHEIPEIEENDWNSIQYVSVDKDNNVLGYFKISIARCAYTISNIAAINFNDTINVTFSKDAYKIIEMLFTNYKFNKIKWSCIIDNPAKHLYEKIVKKFNGRLVGIFKSDVTNGYGQLCDNCWFEITLDDYLKSTNMDNTIKPKRIDNKTINDNMKKIHKNKIKVRKSSIIGEPKTSGLFDKEESSDTGLIDYNLEPGYYTQSRK